MSEESTTPDLVERVRRQFEAANRRDIAGIAGHVRQREGWVYVWVGGLIARLTACDIDEARAAAEGLTAERG
jgi:hypothetical protein